MGGLFVALGTTADFIPLHLNVAGVAALPTKCSRHNSPSQPHALYNVLKSWDPPSTPSGDANERHIVVKSCSYLGMFHAVFFLPLTHDVIVVPLVISSISWLSVRCCDV